MPPLDLQSLAASFGVLRRLHHRHDRHANDIVQIVRDEFGKGNQFAQKITYQTTGAKTEDLIASFRNSYYPYIAVTVYMIATSTDIRPLEVVFFMRNVRKPHLRIVV